MTDAAATRRQLLKAGAALTGFAATASFAQTGPEDEMVPLWPGRPPGDRGATITRRIENKAREPGKFDRWVFGVDRPHLVVRRPARPTGAAVIAIPGGGYAFLSYDNEGEEQAAWLNARGVTVFILMYRLPGEGWDHREFVPLQDAQRAVRLVRANAGRFGVDPKRVSVLGFSAGGHLAGSVATRHAERSYAPVDQIDQLSARPDFAGLVYPVVSTTAPFNHGGSRKNLLGPDASDALRRAASVELRVDADTPPLFLIHTSDDGTVPIENSIALYQAMLAAKRPAQLHAFDEGGHGFGVRLPKTTPASAWPDLFYADGVRRGVFAG